MGVLFKNADITIYNKYYDNSLGADMYQRTVIKGVNWQSKRNGTVSDKGLLLADSTLIFIDKLDNYVSPKRFAKLQLMEREKYFTFTIGDKIVKGEVDFEVIGIQGHRISDLEKEFDDVITIKSVAEFSGHFQVEGV
ncbi:DUF6751 family protein [Clostridium sp.]|uniref:DUF6751 family protein n=1 Tax=Clostridium sp. TaxID=1506 RepID=UPI00290611B5|nr:DUF6751 family protein [Clostridium sp.]MDU7365417.1 DUF6751 family protein [Clostridium sp.]